MYGVTQILEFDQEIGPSFPSRTQGAWSIIELSTFLTFGQDKSLHQTKKEKWIQACRSSQGNVQLTRVWGESGSCNHSQGGQLNKNNNKMKRWQFRTILTNQIKNLYA